MACREGGPWAAPSLGSKCGCCRVDHGLRYNRAEDGVAWWEIVASSHGHVPVLVLLVISTRERIKGVVQPPFVPNRSGIDALWLRHSAVLHHRIEKACGNADVRGCIRSAKAARLDAMLLFANTHVTFSCVFWTRPRNFEFPYSLSTPS